MSVLRIDSHQHFWKFNPRRDAWINDDMRVIQRDFLPNDLAPILESNAIDGCVSVQADQSETETFFLLDQASRHNFIKGVVGWVDLCAANLDERFQALASQNKLKGFRHIVQAEPYDDFMLRSNFQRGIAMLKKYGFTYDILIYPKQLGAALTLVQQFPDQPFVIDHMAKPSIHESRFDNWQKQLSAFKPCDHVYCKLSGMVTEAKWNAWKPDDFLPYLDTVLETFGPNRLMYGSDWPVCLVAASYGEQLDIVQRYIARLSAAEQAAIMGGNAIQFYNLT
jgi:L-fuconolactonase